jgi:hypothetical protein
MDRWAMLCLFAHNPGNHQVIIFHMPPSLSPRQSRLPH